MYYLQLSVVKIKNVESVPTSLSCGTLISSTETALDSGTVVVEEMEIDSVRDNSAMILVEVPKNMSLVSFKLIAPKYFVQPPF